LGNKGLNGRELFLSSTKRQNQDVWILMKCHPQVWITIKNLNFKLFPEETFLFTLACSAGKTTS